ncbi:S1C family serine protease [Saccharopolyspora mangrovi]|uniref:Trypsin-like peptidase domain-containing protein n=1 Tax=Saccharopolyspora mangrovi TaxID=3082379 RepID=A0ABU6AE73_9PSEU|nr:trypsin-like peptidase domain-containing protein [Saccharopolyspora sp. S2-29]MEB3369835.1 trypsin-like peptidase domain-containing protein [Saccharopolyspora sp. S2-29]
MRNDYPWSYDPWGTTEPAEPTETPEAKPDTSTERAPLHGLGERFKRLPRPRFPERAGLKRPSGKKRGVTAVVVLGAALLSSGATAAATYGLVSYASQPAASPQATAAAVQPSVVSLNLSGPQGKSTGSGVVLDEGGRILTNNHVIAKAAGGPVTVTFNDGKKAQGHVVQQDPGRDLAVVQADGVQGLTPAKLAYGEQLEVGQQVIAVGSPLGLPGTVTSGIVSAMHRDVPTGNGAGLGDAIQTDAAINPGNSGGPLVNMDGEVIGINTAVANGKEGTEAAGLGFTVPIDQARGLVDGPAR